MASFLIYDAGIKTGTKYLTTEVAYFLGGIYAANEKVNSDSKLYWAAPVRYNPQYSTTAQTAEHFDYVSVISSKVYGYTVMKDNIKGTTLDSGKNRLPGFSTFFESTGLTDLSAEIPVLKPILISSPVEVKKAFILGVIDGRGTPDISIPKGIIRYLSLDCPNNDIGDFLNDIFINYGLLCNYNTARDRLEGGNPRKPQLRIKDVEVYMKKIGYISPAKFGKMRDVFNAKFGSATVVSGSAFFAGLNYLTR